jgi:hypothetical protein
VSEHEIHGRSSEYVVQSNDSRKELQMKTPLVLRYVIWSMLIFALSMGLLSFRALRSLELRAVDFGFIRVPYPRSASQASGGVEAPVILLPFYESVSQELYLRSVGQITRRLKAVGAKVVLVQLPGDLRPSTPVFTSLQELVRDSIVIIGTSSVSQSYFSNRGVEPDDKQYWWVQHPFFHRLDFPWGVMTENTKMFSRLTRFVPTGFRDEKTGEPVPDIIVLALKRFFDIPDKTELPVSPTRLQIGSYAFPLERDGVTYARLRQSVRPSVGLYASLTPGSDSLLYFPAVATKANDSTALQTAWGAYRGKIVIIDWFGPAGYRYPTRGWVYAHLVSSFFDRSFVKVHNEWNVLLITTLVILLSAVSYVVRNGFMVFISFGMAAGTVAASTWLFNSHDVLFEPVYIIVPILLCGLILPLAKIAGEKRIAEERVKSLEEENRRLRDLQRSSIPGTQA